MTKIESKVSTKETKKEEKAVQKVMFDSANVLNIAPKTIPLRVFHAKDMNPQTMEEMVKVIGKEPKAKFENGKLSLSYGSKFPRIFPNCVINFDSLGNIIWIKDFSEIEKDFNILTK